MKLTVQELATTIEVLNIRSNRNCTIKDLRLIDGVVSMLLEHMPKEPEQPKDTDPETIKKFQDDLKEYHNFEVDIDIHKSALDVIKIKFGTTNVFFDDKLTREKVLKLAEKLGI